MRIGEACRITELTERTIRFYIEKGLLQPESLERNGRVYYNFRDTDIEQLIKISTLRKAGFSIEDITQMERDAASINALLSSHIANMREKEKEYAGILRALSHAEGGQFTSSGALAHALTQGVQAMPLPRADLDPDFTRFDSETPEERERGYADFLVMQRAREKAVVILRPLKIAGLAVCAMALLLLVIYVFSCIPRGIDRKLTGTDFRVGEGTPGTPVGIHVQGKLYRRLFQEPIFKGKIILDTVEYTQDSELEMHFTDGMDGPAIMTYNHYILKGGVMNPDLQTLAQVWTDADFDFLSMNCFDKVTEDSGITKNRVICAPARDAEEGMRLLREKNIEEKISGR